jgi:ankyrin repeat protein
MVFVRPLFCFLNVKKCKNVVAGSCTKQWLTSETPLLLIYSLLFDLFFPVPSERYCFEMSVAKRARDEEEDEHNEDVEEQEDQEQAELDDVLLDACFGGFIEDVKSALTSGGSAVATNESGRTGLSLACERDDWEVALPIVKLLLAKRSAPSTTDEDGWNALHSAARCSSAEVVALVLGKMRKMINIVINNRYSALSLCCLRLDEEVMKVARALLKAGADIESVEAENSRTPLLVACRNNRPELVSLLLERGANVKAVDAEGYNALHLACSNGAFGREIIPLLCNAGVDVLHKASNGDDVMDMALSRSGAMAEMLSKFLPVDYKLEEHYTSNFDPIGSLVVATKFGRIATSNDFSISIAVNGVSELCWAQLRNGVPLLFDESEHDVFNALSRKNSVNLWILASCEPGFQQHPTTGDTVLHLLCRTESLNTEEKMNVLSSLKKDFRNPLIPNFRNQLIPNFRNQLIPNFRNQRAIDLTNDPIVKAGLNAYMQFKPN